MGPLSWKVAHVATQASSDRAVLAFETAMEMQNTEKQHYEHDAGLMLAHMQPLVVTPNFGDEFVDEGQAAPP